MSEINSINLENLIREVRKIYRKTDHKIDKFKKPCKKKCPACCYQFIAVLAVEGIATCKYISNKMDIQVKEIIRRNIFKWFEYFNNHTAHNRHLTEEDILFFEEQSAKDKVPCPLLINSECSIYEVRPLTCRTHFVYDSPQECLKNPRRNPSRESQQIRLEQVKKLVSIDTRYFRPLPYAIAHLLEFPQDQVKPIINFVPISFKGNI